MDVSLGPWTAEMSIDEKQRKPLAEAMGNEAWKTVKNTAGFTPKDAAGKAAKKGFTISGRLTNVLKDGSDFQVKATFTLWIDGTISNVKPVPGDGTGVPAEDVVRAITENRVKKLLDTIKSGKVQKAG